MEDGEWRIEDGEWKVDRVGDVVYSISRIRPLRYSPSGWKMLTG
jgi:hypothetical protein